MSATRRLAAIDIGTVTTRLLVAEVTGCHIAQIERSTDITHLGEGLLTTGSLSPEAMARVAAVIGRYAQRLQALGVEAYRAVATSASRDATNAAHFTRMLAEHGIDISVISGQREADLSFAGAVTGRRGDGLLVVDCGGGSTELVLGSSSDSGPRIVAARSVDVGSRRMTERFFRADPPDGADLDAARAWATHEMRGYFDRLDERPRSMIALAGTATTLAAVRLGLKQYDSALVHGFEITGSDAADLLELFVDVPIEERRLIPGLHPERAGVIVAGTLILETVLALSGLDRFIVSEQDILYGILLDTYRDLQESSP
ncbi:MAG: Ppx/GppA phosphatase family protein [Coriobacteriia bacterium]|nr:Ppx/GppA phosphatase family protein [Coriobacteriia bacterium]